MEKMTLYDIAKACGGELLGGNHGVSQACASSVIIDSRKIEKDSVFIATRGARVDGHSFIEQVFEEGALGVVCEEAPKRDFGPYILVDDSFEALKKIAAYYRTVINARVIGITGSVGKTSTKEFVATVLEQQFKTWKTQGNFNNEIGMPLTILQAKEEHEALVLEMGINHFGEMERLSAISKPEIMVITNIGDCHLEYLEDRDGVFRAKTECFKHLSADATVILNGDDDKLINVSDVNGKKPVFFGKSDKHDYYFSNVVNKGLLGSDVTLHSLVRDYSIDVSIPLPGVHMIYNALVAMAVGDVLLMNPLDIAKGIEAVKATVGRSNIARGESLVVIDDCYNANPVSMKSAIDLLTTADSRKVAILGDMFELGDDENELHAQVGNYCNNKTDVIICVGRMSKFMFDAVKPENVSERYYFKNKDEAIDKLPQILKNGDSVLVKASNGMKFGEIVDQIIKLRLN